MGYKLYECKNKKTFNEYAKQQLFFYGKIQFLYNILNIHSSKILPPTFHHLIYFQEYFWKENYHIFLTYLHRNKRNFRKPTNQTKLISLSDMINIFSALTLINPIIHSTQVVYTLKNFCYKNEISSCIGCIH